MIGIHYVSTLALRQLVLAIGYGPDVCTLLDVANHTSGKIVAAELVIFIPVIGIMICYNDIIDYQIY